jgi:hypothetical protein
MKGVSPSVVSENRLVVLMYHSWCPFDIERTDNPKLSHANGRVTPQAK